jgi:hypothetical protein
MAEANQTRQEKRYQVNQKLREIEGYSYKAHLEHIEEIKKIHKKRFKIMEEEAKLSFERGQRDMSAHERVQNLFIQLEQEALESKRRLIAIEQDL